MVRTTVEADEEEATVEITVESAAVWNHIHDGVEHGRADDEMLTVRDSFDIPTGAKSLTVALEVETANDVRRTLQESASYHEWNGRDYTADEIREIADAIAFEMSKV